jgi:hypothetical protein
LEQSAPLVPEALGARTWLAFRSSDAGIPGMDLAAPFHDPIVPPAPDN